MNNDLTKMSKKAANTWRGTSDYWQAAEIIDFLVAELEKSETELAGYREAAADGRLVVLPVALGQKVWFNSWDGVRSGTISSKQQKADGTWNVRITDDEHRCVFDRPMSTLENEWFLSRKEVEAAFERIN